MIYKCIFPMKYNTGTMQLEEVIINKDSLIHVKYVWGGSCICTHKGVGFSMSMSQLKFCFIGINGKH